jgi:TATA-box binding protein (TBP) (component of TFIID and TFIIIB)
MEIQNLNITNWNLWLNEQKKKQIPDVIVTTPLKISTITTNCRIFYKRNNSDTYEPIFINYLTFFNIVKLSQHGIVFKKYRFKAQKWDWETVRQYSRPPQKMTRKNSKMKGVFYNQVTLEIYSEYNKKEITVFLYDNGSCNNTGNKSIEDTFIVSDKIMQILTYIHIHEKPILYHYQNVNLSNYDETQCQELENFLNMNLIPLDLNENVGKLINTNINISTMNAKYNAGIKINRDALLKLIKKDNEMKQDSDIYLALLETSNYAGLNIKIRWKKNCQETIHQKQKKKWKCKCSDITILAFQSGEIMISGAKSFEQLDYVKDIFDKLIRENVSEIIDIDLHSIVSLPNQKRIKRIHKYFTTKEVADKTFIVVSESCSKNEHETTSL